MLSRACRSRREKALRERLGELRTRCERDPEGIIHRLEAEIPPLRVRRTLAKRRARATALLATLLDPERRRVGRLMAGPLNDQLAPWMTTYPDPKKPLNRHDAKAAMDGMFGTFQSRTREPVLEAFRSSVCLPQ
jgi:hypothetical protein